MLPSLSNEIADHLRHLDAQSRLRSLLPLSGASRTRVTHGGKPLLSFCSNDYLGLASHPGVVAAAHEAALKAGYGSGSSRLVSGTSLVHEALERSLAAFLGLPSALLFPSGYHANISAITALAGPQDLIVLDRAVHASIIDGARLSRAKIAVYPHLDVKTAERHLARLGPTARRRLLVSESLFSMDGDVPSLPELSAIATKYDAIFVLDDAHAFGALGQFGRGLSSSLPSPPDVLVATLGKALGCAGAFVAGTSDLIQYLVNTARPFLFTTSPPIPMAAAAQHALSLVSSQEGDQLRSRLAHAVAYLRQLLSLPQDPHSSPIIPLILGDDHAALSASETLRSQGFLLQPIRPPTVRPGTSRLRITLSASHTDHEIESLASALRTLSSPPTNLVHPRPSDQRAQSIPCPRSHEPNLPSRGLTILGTDTGVGKTTVAVALLRILANSGHKPIPFKPVETGANPTPADANRLLTATSRTDLPLALVCPHSFPDPISPAAASAKANQDLTLHQLLRDAARIAPFGDFLLTETAGGLLSPYAPSATSLDLAIALHFPVLLLAKNGLGTISTTALAIQEILRRSVPFVGYILVTTSPSPTPDQPTNGHWIQHTTGIPPLGTLPFQPTTDPASLAEALSANLPLSTLLPDLLL